jgi:hypothetical protein
VHTALGVDDARGDLRAADVEAERSTGSDSLTGTGSDGLE